MHFIATVAVLAGAAILLYSILQYYRFLQYLRAESNARRVFSRWGYAAGMALMMFFLMGYVLVAISFVLQWVRREDFREENALIMLIFLFGAMFVRLMVHSQIQMAGTISKKSQEIVKALVCTVEAKDPYTQGHSVHVACLVNLMYRHLPPHLQAQVNIINLQDAAILHDIGKIGLPDGILNKPGPLSDEEWELVRQHPGQGKNILDDTSYEELGRIILAHHERVDGNGYYKMQAEDIPIEAKIIGIADTFSALTTDRVYRPKRTYGEAISVLKEVAGSQLDAEMVREFCAIPQYLVEKAAEGCPDMERNRVKNWTSMGQGENGAAKHLLEQHTP